MWVLPLVAAGVAFVFAALLGRRFAARRQGYQLVWAAALVMYGVASLAVTAAALNGWSERLFEVYWAFGAVLNVPFLAAGELQLLIRNRAVHVMLYVVLAVLTVYTFSVLQGATFDPAELAERLPSGKDVFGAGSDAHRLPQLISIPSYLILLGGALWSAWRMRGRPELRDRCYGTLLIAAGATLIAGFGSAFAAIGNLPWFSIALLAGISVMFAGFLRASRPARTSTSPIAA